MLVPVTFSPEVHVPEPILSRLLNTGRAVKLVPDKHRALPTFLISEALKSAWNAVRPDSRIKFPEQMYTIRHFSRKQSHQHLLKGNTKQKEETCDFAWQGGGVRLYSKVGVEPVWLTRTRYGFRHE